MQTATQPQRERVTFALNIPQLLVLEFNPPTEPREGRYGDQFMYFFAGEKIAWFDPPVHAAIVATGAQAGDAIAVTKRESREGNRRRIEWDAQIVQNEPADAIAAALTTPAPPTPANGNPRPAAPAPAPTPTTPTPRPESHSLADTLFGALCTAIDAAALAERYAAEKGLRLQFSAEDIRTCANALMMRQERAGRA
jgi:hypothetical protein